MQIKPGVKVQGIQPEMLLAAFAVIRVYGAIDIIPVITSALDGQHSPRSKHKLGYALDIRTRDIPQPLLDDIALALQSDLGSEYFVLLESDHLHIQFNGSEIL